jgi:hypothetical protein
MENSLPEIISSKINNFKGSFLPKSEQEKTLSWDEILMEFPLRE